MVVEGAAYAALRRLEKAAIAVEERDYDYAMDLIEETERRLARMKAKLDDVANDPEYMNHPNLLRLLGAGYRQHIRGESLLEQKVLRHPWQQHSGAAYVSTDDRVTGEKHARRKERG